MKKTSIIIIIVILGIVAWWQFGFKNTLVVTNFNECAAVGNPVMESYPRQCRDGDKTFTENIGNELEKTDLIRINTPRPNQIIKSPLIIEGEARGTWFFEGDFPIVLTDWDGLIIAEGFATAQGEWMTEEFVPFTATLEFNNQTYKSAGLLILKKDNPSGLPLNDDALEVPVFFEEIDQSGNTGILPFDSGAKGQVLLGPTCPVIQNPPDNTCADKPYVTTVQVIAIGSLKSSPFAVVETDKEGRYKVMLPPGEYSLQAIGGTYLPRCEPKNITIGPDIMLETDIYCDTGIR